jgi:3-hydroxybutyryl-CoA dehydrogenase
MKVLVCGAGTMGSGIAQVIAQCGHEVFLRDIDEKFVNRGIQGINKNLTRSVDKGKLALEEKDAIMSRITGLVELQAAKDVDLVIEAIVEKMEVKKALFKELDDICQPSTIFASNTSALSISELAASTKRADKVIGMHFFNPAPVMKLVEVIKGAATSEQTYEFIIDFTKQLGKNPVAVEEAPGFLVNRILIPMINEATFILQEGIASAKDIDDAMKLGANHPIGPLALGDLVGLDVCLFIMETLYTETGDSKYRPCPLLRKMVRAGHLGRKTGKGFFIY